MPCCLLYDPTYDPTCVLTYMGVGHRPHANVGEETTCMCLTSIQCAMACLGQGMVDENKSSMVSLQMSIGPITRARPQKLQKAFNGLVK